LPGLAGFWGEFTALLSSYSPASGLKVETFRVFMVVGAIGTVLAAGYLLWLYQRAFFGEESPLVEDAEHHGHISDILPIEYLAWTPLLIGILVFGLFPNLLFRILDPAVGVALRAVG
jgi:NADH-quinone oxidoreductase subunit M